MNHLNIISIFILFIIIISLVIFHFKYIAQFDFRVFMEELERQVNSKKEIDLDTKNLIMDAFEKLFNRYFDNAILEFTMYKFTSFFVMFFTIIAMFISTIWQFCNNCIKCKNYCIIILPIYSLVNMIIYFMFAFGSEYKINLSEKYLNIYTDKLNEEIRKNLDYMFYRKIYLIACVFFAVFGIIGQLVITIIGTKNKDDKIPENLYLQPNNNEGQN